MPVSTILFRSVALLLLALSSTLPTRAQTAPSWISAKMIPGQPLPGNMLAKAAAVDAAGNIYRVGGFRGTMVVGDTTLTSAGQDDAFIAKYSPTGVRLWVRMISTAANEFAESLVLDAAGNAYVAGRFTSSASLGNALRLNGSRSYTKGFLVRYSSQGLPEWVQQTQEGTPEGSVQKAGGVGLDAAGNVYWAALYSQAAIIGGSSVMLPGNVWGTGVFLARFSAATGTLRSLVPTFHFLGFHDYSPRLAVAPTGEAYIITDFSSFSAPPIIGGTQSFGKGNDDVLITRYNAAGVLDWEQRIGGIRQDRATQVQADAAGNLYVAGSFAPSATFGTTTLGVNSNSSLISYLAKYSPQGAMLWTQLGDGGNFNIWHGLCLDAAGNAYVTGYFTGTTQFGSHTLTNVGSGDVAVVSYSPQGVARWAMRAGGRSTIPHQGYFVGVDGQSRVYVEGRFADAIQFGPYSLTETAASGDNFQAWLGYAPLATHLARPQALSLYPNPASDQVHLPTLAPGTGVQFVDARGRVARQTTVSAAARVSVRGLAPGLYTLRTTTTQGQPFAGRVVVE